MSEGHVVRIRRLTHDGAVPVRAVIEIDRRVESPRLLVGGGHPPVLMSADGESESAVVASLLPHMHDDESVARLIAQHSLR
jgi:hypothetical protein